MPLFQPACLADLPAFGCAHAQDEAAGTGCTVIVAPEGAVCGVDVRGGGPATRETDLLRPENMVEAVHAVTLSGGSAFGLEASCGAMDALAARGIGFPVGGAHVPIVVGACLFDLLVGENAHPDKAMGRAAAEAALAQWERGLRAGDGGSTSSAGDGGKVKATEGGAGAADACPGADAAQAGCAQGNVGAGCGATVGKLLGGERAMKAGFGTAGVRAGELACVALVAVNALGNVCDADGTWIAGCRGDGGAVMDPMDAFGLLMAQAAEDAGGTGKPAPAEPGAAGAAAGGQGLGASPAGHSANTTIGCVVTNARLTKAQATKAASTVHDAYARAIKPVHTLNDGDTVFVMASGDVEAPPDLVSVAATEAMQQAIVAAVRNAPDAYGLPGLGSR